MKSNKKALKLEEAEAVVPEQPPRLCSEIQLFDLCELEKCRYRDGRYCTDSKMLARFEAVAEPEDRPLNIPDDDDEEDELNSSKEEFEEDDDGYSVFDEEDTEELPEDEDW